MELFPEKKGNSFHLICSPWETLIQTTHGILKEMRTFANMKVSSYVYGQLIPNFKLGTIPFPSGLVNENDPTTKLIIFASNYSLKLFQACKAIFIDGTFRMSPRLWKQILIINVELDDHLSFPVIFVLLPNKMTETYKKAFHEIRKLLEDLELPEVAATQAMVHECWSCTCQPSRFLKKREAMGN